MGSSPVTTCWLCRHSNPGLELATTGVHWMTELPLVARGSWWFCWCDRYLTPLT
jgi:hypothetical protein